MQPRSEGLGGVVHRHSADRGSISSLKPWVALRDAWTGGSEVFRDARGSMGTLRETKSLLVQSHILTCRRTLP